MAYSIARTKHQWLNKLGYYFSVSVLQSGVLLFVLIVSGIYEPFYEAPTASAVVVTPRKIPKTTIVQSGRPIRIRIPSISLDRELFDGVYNSDDGSWTLSPTGIHYAIASAPANDYGGSTFIYAHSNKDAFGPLKNMKFGDRAELYTDNGLVFTYRYSLEASIAPSDTTPLTYQESPPRLTLQTCTGNWHQLREMHYFELINVRDESA